MSEKLYKILDGALSYGGGEYTWSLPTKNADGTWTPGEWTKPIEGDLVACQNAYHLCREKDLVVWLGPDIYEAEAGSEILEENDKVLVRSCRLVRKIEAWNERTARLFAAWCTRQALKLVDDPDPRSVAAVDTAEKYANGEASSEELAAARAAAWDACDAWDAARDVTRAVAWFATWDAARDVTRAVARFAAWDAWDARVVARDVTRFAAWDAAWDAARDAQSKKLLEMLGE